MEYYYNNQSLTSQFFCWIYRICGSIDSVEETITCDSRIHTGKREVPYLRFTQEGPSTETNTVPPWD